MKVLVEVDMEGISGIVTPQQVMPGEARYEEARKFLTGDINACVEGCFRGGANRVTVWDAHARGQNLLWDQADPRPEYIQGVCDFGRLHDIADYDALILLGFHALAGTRSAVLEHTMSSAGWQNFWINGRKAGELAIDAGIAGDAGVPTIMVSGDDKACAEARRWIPGVYTAQVKVGRASAGAQLLSKAAAHKLITETAETACRNYRKIKPLVHRKPVAMRLEVVERKGIPDKAGNRPWLRLIDGRTYEVRGATTAEALARL
jgi:D-amino peptidase